MIEIWRDIEGFIGFYQVSNFGRVRSLEHYAKHINNSKRLIRGRIIKQLNNHTGNGYLYVFLSKNGKEHRFYVHRLVAQAFIPNPDNLPCVNHKDENPFNNCVDNLEWCTIAYNNCYGTKIQRQSKTMTGRTNTKHSKPVSQYTLDGELVKVWPSASEITRQTGWSRGNINNCCRGEKQTAYGYIWRFYSL